MARPKKNAAAMSGAPMDPMTAAIMAGLKPHIDAAVKEQLAAMLAGMLAKVAPELLAKSVPSSVESVPETVHAKGLNGTKKGAVIGTNGAE